MRYIASAEDSVSCDLLLGTSGGKSASRRAHLRDFNDHLAWSELVASSSPQQTPQQSGWKPDASGGRKFDRNKRHKGPGGAPKADYFSDDLRAHCVATGLCANYQYGKCGDKVDGNHKHERNFNGKKVTLAHNVCALCKGPHPWIECDKRS